MITDENHAEIFSAISGRTQREVDQLVSTLQPKSSVKEQIKPIAVGVKNPARTEDSLFSLPLGEKPPATIPTQSLRNRHGGKDSDRIEQRFEIRFSLSATGMKQLSQVQALLSGSYPKGISVEQTVEALMAGFLKRHSPTERAKRREVRKNRVVQPHSKKITRQRRHLSASVRDAVFEKDGGSCCYVGLDGHRCGSTWDLEVDHVQPYARGGSNELSNLRLLCRLHNNLEAKRHFGR